MAVLVHDRQYNIVTGYVGLQAREAALDKVWGDMSSRANTMLTVLLSQGPLRLSHVICSPVHIPFDTLLDREFDEFQTRYTVVKLLVGTISHIGHKCFCHDVLHNESYGMATLARPIAILQDNIMAVSRRAVLICERDMTQCCLMQDHHGLINLTPPLAFWPDLLQVMVTCTTDVSDVNKHADRDRMRKNCLACYYSYLRDRPRRFTEQVSQALKEQYEASVQK